MLTLLMQLDLAVRMFPSRFHLGLRPSHLVYLIHLIHLIRLIRLNRHYHVLIFPAIVEYQALDQQAFHG